MEAGMGLLCSLATAWARTPIGFSAVGIDE
jgi:hypothetical protein